MLSRSVTDRIIFLCFDDTVDDPVDCCYAAYASTMDDANSDGGTEPVVVNAESKASVDGQGKKRLRRCLLPTAACLRNKLTQPSFLACW